MSCVPVVRAVAMLALAFTAGPAFGQQTARQFIEEGLRATGMSVADVASLALIDSQSETVDKGLVIDLASVRPRVLDPSTDNAKTIVALALNPTDQPWCIRPKGAINSPTLQGAQLLTVNRRVDPGTSAQFAEVVVLPNASGIHEYRLQLNLAVWTPNFLMAEASQCDTNEPEYLADWLASDVHQPYVDFEAEYENATEEMGEFFENQGTED